VQGGGDIEELYLKSPTLTGCRFKSPTPPFMCYPRKERLRERDGKGKYYLLGAWGGESGIGITVRYTKMRNF
jgi:hypothetical protein